MVISVIQVWGKLSK